MRVTLVTYVDDSLIGKLQLALGCSKSEAKMFIKYAVEHECDCLYGKSLLIWNKDTANMDIDFGDANLVSGCEVVGRVNAIVELYRKGD